MTNAPQLEPGRPQPDDQTRSRVLIVDDIATNRSVLKSLLSRPEREILEATDGEQALELITQAPLDLVILDVLMPGLSGMEVLKRIRARFSDSELPILMLSVKDDIADVVKALESGANDYVTRPFDYTILMTRVNALVSYKQTQDSIREAHSELESRIAERTGKLVRANRALQSEVAERKQAEEKARISQERYRALYNDTPAMFFSLDGDGRIVSANQFGANYLGYTVEDIVGKRISDLHVDSDRAPVLGKLEDCLGEPQGVQRWNACMLHRDGSRIWVRTAARLMPEGLEGADSILMVCEDITEAHTLSERLKYQAKHDALTGLVNRYELERCLKELLRDAREHHTCHALLYMDLDHFKVINDTCGHDAGDELLRQLGRALSARTASTDTLARLGGDEFAVLLRNCGLEQATAVAHDLHRLINGYRFVWRSARFGIGVSIGVVAIEHSTQDVATLLSAADTACYSAKEKEPKQVHVYQPDDKAVIRRYQEMSWIGRIDNALEDNRFELFYQRIVPIDPAGSHGRGADREEKDHYELLLRMRDEHGRIVEPASFLPAAERYRYSTKLDRRVVRLALQWLVENPDLLERLSMCSINLSGHSISDNSFLCYLLEQLEDFAIPPSKLCFELTETATISNLVGANELIDELRGRGCQFALDDFGTGLSSFEYLKTLAVDFIKIDGQFISNIVDDPVNYTMVKSINDIAKVMSKRTIAEFVDSEAVLATLGEIGIDYAQGYIIARPKPLSNLLTGG